MSRYRCVPWVPRWWMTAKRGMVGGGRNPPKKWGYYWANYNDLSWGHRKNMLLRTVPLAWRQISFLWLAFEAAMLNAFQEVWGTGRVYFANPTPGTEYTSHSVCLAPRVNFQDWREQLARADQIVGDRTELPQGLTDSLVVVNWKLSWFGMRTQTLCIYLNQHGQWFHLLNHLWFLQCHWASIQRYQTNPHPEQQNMSLTGCIGHIRTVLQVSVGMLSCSLLCRLETQTLRSFGTSYCGRCSLWSCPSQ